MNTTMNDVFSISRVWLLLKKDFTENYKFYGIGALAFLFAMVSVMILCSPVFCLPNGEVGTALATFPFVYVYTIGCGVAASLMFAQMRTKQGRVSLFTIPATTAEKYVEQLLVYVVGFAVLYVCCVELAELIRCLVAPLVWGSLSVDTGRFINHFATVDLSEDQDFVEGFSALGFGDGNFGKLMVFSTLAQIGLFTLASVLWPKYSYIKMYALNYAVSMVIGLVMLLCVFVFHASMEIHDVWKTVIQPSIWFNAVLAVATFVASYWFFKHKDVIR